MTVSDGPDPAALAVHYDGRRFFNPASMRLPERPAEPEAQTPSQHRSTLARTRAIVRWQMRARPRWPDWLIDPMPQGDPHAQPAAGHVDVTFIGHATFLLRVGRRGRPPFTIITDPVFSLRCSPFRSWGPRRHRPPGRTLAELPPIDLILVSHCHYDHLDLPSLGAIARRDDPAVVTLTGNARHIRKAGLRRIVERDWWESIALHDLIITATPARHGSARTPFDRNRALWGGFFIAPDRHTPHAPSIVFAGDSGHGAHWRWIRERLGQPDLALLPVGAYDPRTLMRAVHVNPEEAVEAFSSLAPHRAVPMHYGTFQLTDEPIGEPLTRLHAACVAAGHDPARFAPLPQGTVRSFGRRAETGDAPSRLDLESPVTD